MRRCIELGLIAKERGDSPVGAVLACDGEIIAEGIEAGRTEGDITCHAEVEAIREALRFRARQRTFELRFGHDTRALHNVLGM
ncbi:MAG: hypothetical protein R2682_15575 [Pyrinomonadaceae bacterium]